jgi:hypothetical protein
LIRVGVLKKAGWDLDWHEGEKVDGKDGSNRSDVHGSGDRLSVSAFQYETLYLWISVADRDLCTPFGSGSFLNQGVADHGGQIGRNLGICFSEDETARGACRI